MTLCGSVLVHIRIAPVFQLNCFYAIITSTETELNFPSHRCLTQKHTLLRAFSSEKKFQLFAAAVKVLSILLKKCQNCHTLVTQYSDHGLTTPSA
jgi:hypothetical protein